MNEIFKETRKVVISVLISSLVGSFIGIASFYITTRLALASLDLRVAATETGLIEIKDTSVRKDVLEEVIQPVRKDIQKLESKIDRLIERESNR
jgi:chromosomal replication initiation ATPase DnaA